MSALRPLCLSCLAFLSGGWVLSVPLRAEESAMKPVPGDWVNLPKDGTPWTHPETGLTFPQVLQDFSLRGGFRDKRDTTGSVALTYARNTSPMTATIMIDPCKQNLALVSDIMAVASAELSKQADGLARLAKDRDYTEKSRSPMDSQAINLWQQGSIPMVSQTATLEPDKPDLAHPPMNHWMAVLIYKDHFVHLSVMIPADDLATHRETADALITDLLACIRYPALVDSMKDICRLYSEKPLTEEGRQAADSLVKFSKESPVFEIIFPGEAITPALNQINARSKDASLDLLRAFAVGSGYSTLKNGSANDALLQGTTTLLKVWQMQKDQQLPVASPVLDELQKAANEGRAVTWLHEHMKKSL